MFDQHPSLAIGTVLIAPSPALSGTTLTLNPGEGARFQANSPCTFFPPERQPSKANAEIGYVTAVNGDQLTVLRAQETTTARAITTGWTVIAGPTAKTFTDIEDALDAKVDQVPGKGLSTNDYTTNEQSKLAGIAAGATQNASDAALRDRTTHTGTQAIATVTGLQTALDSKLVAADVANFETTTQLNARDTANRSRSNHTGTQIASTNSEFNSVASAATPVQTVAGKTGTVTVTKSDVGLGNADNTSDANKPVSTATQTALDAKLDKNSTITGATKTKVTYDSKGLVTAGADATQDDIVDGTTYKQYASTEKTKLAGIAAGATANDTDANLKNRANHTGTETASTISDFNSAADARVSAAVGSTVQGYDADLQAIGAISPCNDDIIQRKAGAWTNRTPAQVKTDLALTKADVGLANVDNTSDATKNSASATLTNKTISGASNIISNIAQSSVTNGSWCRPWRRASRGRSGTR
jgi:hypothetical protein